MSTDTYVDLSTILGRVVAGLRQDLGKSQAKFSAEIGWDRSLLSRIESGRNSATFDNVFELEEAFLREERISEHGDLTRLTERVVRRARARGLRPVYGQIAKPSGEEPIATPALDRIVLAVIDRWLNDGLDEEEEP